MTSIVHIFFLVRILHRRKKLNSRIDESAIWRTRSMKLSMRVQKYVDLNVGSFDMNLICIYISAGNIQKNQRFNECRRTRRQKPRSKKSPIYFILSFFFFEENLSSFDYHSVINARQYIPKKYTYIIPLAK